MIRLISFEFQKIFQKKIVLIGIGLLIALNVMMSNGWIGGAIQTEEGKILEGMESIRYKKEKTAEYNGILTEEMVQKILTDTKQEDLFSYPFMWNAQLYLSLAQFFANDDGSYNGRTIQEAFPEVNAPLILGFTEGHTSFLHNMMYITMCAGFLVIITIAPIFSEEYTRGTDGLILTSRYGKKQCAKAKIIVSLLFSFLLELILIAVNLIVFLGVYGTDGLEASIQINHMGLFTQVPYSMTYLQGIAYSVLLWLCSIITLAVITLFCSVLCKTSFLALAVGSFLYVTPMFIDGSGSEITLKLLALAPIRSLTEINIFDLYPISMFGNEVLYPWFIAGFMVVLAVSAWMIIRKVFARHQVVSG